MSPSFCLIAGSSRTSVTRLRRRKRDIGPRRGAFQAADRRRSAPRDRAGRPRRLRINEEGVYSLYQPTEDDSLLVGRFDMAARARARAAVRRMAASCEGPRLPSRWRGISAGRIAHILLRTAEFAAALFIVARAGAGLDAGARAHSAGRPARPDRTLACRSASATSTQSPSDRPTSCTIRGAWVWASQGLTVRDAAGRTVLSAPGGKVGLDPFALALLEVKVRRLELDGLDLRLRVAADGALSLAVASDSGATPIPLPGAAPAGERRYRSRRPRPGRAPKPWPAPRRRLTG